MRFRVWIPLPAAVALTSAGMRDGLLGVAWPSIRRDFRRPLDDAGVAAGPVFPLLMACTPGRVAREHAPNVISLQVAFATLGQATLPTVLGSMARHCGVHTLSAGFVGLSLVAAAWYVALERTRVACPPDPAPIPGVPPAIATGDTPAWRQ
jgi:hypothetical protein